MWVVVKDVENEGVKDVSVEVVTERLSESVGGPEKDVRPL